MRKTGIAKFIVMAAAAPVLLVACSSEEPVSFTQDVRPILDQHCISCHTAGGAGQQASGFSMETYADLMKGTQAGPMIVAGDSLGSNILVLMEGRADPSISMPHGSMKPVPQKEIDTIRRWVEQGAKNN
jgi:mono/diheme cytochrome c family protein